MIPSKRLLVSLLALATLHPSKLHAQQSQGGAGTPPAAANPAKPIGGFAPNLPTPSSPALVILGVAPDKAIQPTSLNALATSLASGVDKDGRVQTGLALDITPFMVLGAKHLSRDTYVNNWFARLASRTSLSVATTKAAGSAGSSQNTNSKAVQAAFGINATIVDLGDRRADLIVATCLAAATNLTGPPVVKPPPPLSSGADLSQEEKTKRDKAATAANNEAVAKKDADAKKGGATACREAADKRLWNRSAIAFGFAQAWQSSSGLAGDLARGGHAAWLSGAYGFERVKGLESVAQAVLYLQHETGALAAASGQTSPPPDLSQTTLGIRLRLGTGSTAISLDESRILKDSSTSSSQKWSTAFSLHQHVTGDVWLTLAIGAEARPGSGGRQIFVLDSLSWAYGAK